MREESIEEQISTLLGKPNGKGPDFDLVALDVPVPVQVENTCSIFNQRFLLTADRLDTTAEKLERMAQDLRDKARNIRNAASELPEHIRSWVTTERSYIADAQFFDPITK